MELEILAARLSDRKVLQTIEAASYSIDLLPPNGAIIHMRVSIRALLGAYAYGIKKRDWVLG